MPARLTAPSASPRQAPSAAPVSKPPVRSLPPLVPVHLHSTPHHRFSSSTLPVLSTLLNQLTASLSTPTPLLQAPSISPPLPVSTSPSAPVRQLSTMPDCPSRLSVPALLARDPDLH